MSSAQTNRKRNRSDKPQKKALDKSKRKALEKPVKEIPGIIASQLQGLNNFNAFYRLTQGKSYIDLETDIAAWKTQILEPLINYLITDNVIDKWNATQVDNYEDLIVYGSQMLIELKNQFTQIAYCPRLTRSNVTAGSTFDRPNLITLQLSIAQEVRIPPICYSIAELYTPVVQIMPAAYYNAYEAKYFQPFRPHKVLTEIETLLDTISGLYAAQVFATQAKAPLVPISIEWLRRPTEIPYHSWYGNLLGVFWPCNYDNGGAENESFLEIDETTPIYTHAALGIPEYFDALSFYRSHSCADDPAAIVVENIANDKINLLVGNINSTALAEVDKTNTNFRWLLQVAAAQSTSATGIFFPQASTTYASPFIRYNPAPVRPSPTSWDLLASLWLKRHWTQPPSHFSLYDISGDLIMSAMRRSGKPLPAPGLPNAGEIGDALRGAGGFGDMFDFGA
jgi:hypothetical protein